MPNEPVALVTGAARRIGACIAETLHDAGYRVVIHCRRSREEANALALRLNAKRENSAHVITWDLLREDAGDLAKAAASTWDRLDLLVNNASSFFPTAIGKTGEQDWNDLIGSNLRAPFFLSQAAVPFLQETHGSIINIIDVHGERPLAGHAVYSTAKAGLHMMTRALAKEVGPEVRVNGVAPGAILWPERDIDDAGKAMIINATPLKRTGSPRDIAEAILFLARSRFITGQIIAIDGGRSL